MGWKLGSVFVLAWVAIIPSLFLGAGLDQLRLVLGFTGSALVMVYVVGKGVGIEAPKFVAAKTRLIATLVIMAIGVVIASTGALEYTFQSSSGLGFILELVGTLIFVIGIGAMVLVLVLAPS